MLCIGPCLWVLSQSNRFFFILTLFCSTLYPEIDHKYITEFIDLPSRVSTIDYQRCNMNTSSTACALGKHILVEFYGCSSGMIEDANHIEQSMLKAAEASGATIVNSLFHHFSPFGVSGVVVIQESHFTIHTWPEYAYAAVDLFTCGDSIEPQIACQLLTEALKAEHNSIIELDRGQVDFLGERNAECESLTDVPTKKSIDDSNQSGAWFVERDQDIALSLRFRSKKILQQKSLFQTIKLYDTYAYGKMLVLDDKVMCTEEDEYAYHEMIVHVPMLTHPRVRKALVIGGGDGGTVRELVKHETIGSVTMVEIDEAVINTSKKFLPTLSSALIHPKLKLIIGDALEYISACGDESYDLIIIDSCDPIGPAAGLFTPDFYNDVHRCLKEDGVMVAQSGSPKLNPRVFRETYDCQRKIFGFDQVHCYLSFIPTYPTGMWSFSYCTKSDLNPVTDLDHKRVQVFVEKHSLNYYNESVHCAAFSLPNFVKKILD